MQVNLKHNKNSFLCNYYGNTEASKTIIFVHGIGVRWDAKGMFTEVADVLQDRYRVALFDLNDIDPKTQEVTMSGLNYQAERLAIVIDFIRNELQAQSVDIVAHSFGGVVTGMLAPEGLNKIIINCSPIQNPYARIKNRFMQREGTVIDEAGVSKIKRSSGDFTYVNKDFWQETQTVQPIELYKNLKSKSELYYIRALQENVLFNEDYAQVKNLIGQKYYELPGDHDFSGEDRVEWVKKIDEIIAS